MDIGHHECFSVIGLIGLLDFAMFSSVLLYNISVQASLIKYRRGIQQVNEKQ